MDQACTTEQQAIGAAPRRRKAAKHPMAEPIARPPEARFVEVVESYFGADGRPVKRKSLGAARVARRYDHSGNQIEEAYYNSCGKPTARRGLGVARIHWTYDANGRKVEAEFFGSNGDLLAREAAIPSPETTGG